MRAYRLNLTMTKRLKSVTWAHSKLSRLFWPFSHYSCPSQALCPPTPPTRSSSWAFTRTGPSNPHLQPAEPQTVYLHLVKTRPSCKLRYNPTFYETSLYSTSLKSFFFAKSLLLFCPPHTFIT